jgi:hypothetical protein
MDHYVIINEFFSDIADRVSDAFSSSAESTVTLERNWYC